MIKEGGFNIYNEIEAAFTDFYTSSTSSVSSEAIYVITPTPIEPI